LEKLSEMNEVQLSPIQTEIDGQVVSETVRLCLTDDVLVVKLRKQYPRVHLFFCLMGQLWPDSNWSMLGKVCQYVWSASVPVFIVWSFVYGVIVITVSSGLGYFICLGISLCLQTSILIPTIPAMNRRLHSKCCVVDLDFYGPSLLLCSVVFLISVACGTLIGINTFCVSSNPRACSSPGFHIFAILDLVGQIALSCILALNTLFVLVDSRTSVRLVDELTKAHEEKAMTIAIFNEYRSNILQRVKSNYWTYNSVLFIAIINILIMIILAYFHDDTFGGVTWPAPFVKEIPFVLISLYYSTMVNEKADRLTRMLGTTIWSKNDIEADHTRLFYFANSEAEKISFTLSGMRLKRKDLLLRIGASLLAFVIGLLKSAVLNS
jgi:hypothetical protein